MQDVAWPPNYTEEKRRRLTLWNKLRFNEPLLKKVNDYYRFHPAEWIGDFGITFDPRRRQGSLIPFVLFKRQKEYIQFLFECWRDKEHGLTEKARDMGATWDAVAFAVWLWRYHQGSVIGFGSLKAEQVDKHNDPKAIFPKARQFIDNVPSFMRPEGYNSSVHAPYMRIINPVNGSVMTGESGDNMGRGGRTTLYFKDESAHYEHPELIEAALGDNTDVQQDISSVNGPANVFYRKRMAGEIWYPGKPCTPGKVRVFIFDWSDHPLKTQQWHDMRERKAEGEGLLHIFRQEVDRDYLASIDCIIIRPEWVNAAVDAHIALNLASDGEKVAGQDVADGGGDKNALVIRHGIVLRFAEDWGGESGEAAKRALPYCVEYQVKDLCYDSIGVGAGFKTEINHLKTYPNFPKHLKVLPWNAGATPIEPDKNIIPGDKQSPLNKDQYLNLKAQAWFRLRTRFYKTFQAVKNGKSYPPEDLISLDSTMPKLHELKMQLSQATYSTNNKGKTVVEKNPDGTLSPNLADAAVICYCPVRAPIGFFDV